MKGKTSVIAAVLVLMISVLGCTETSQSQTGRYKNIDQSEFAGIVKTEKARVIDVRTAEEVGQGFIKGTTIFADIYSPEFETIINKLDKSKPYVVYCRSGSRSSSAAEYMVSQGFKKVYNLNGGISSWKGEIDKR